MKLAQLGQSLYNIEHKYNLLITFPNGIPIKNASGKLMRIFAVVFLTQKQ